MKTIFISTFHPYTFRNILATDALKKLIERDDIRVVLFVFGYKKDYFERQFASPKIIIEGIDFGTPSHKFLLLLMKRVAKYGLDTSSTRIEKRMKLRLEKKFFYFIALAILGILMTRLWLISKLMRRLMRAIDYRVAAKDRYKIYFEKYQPDLVVVTDIQNERDVEIVHNARNFGVPVVGLVRSWDNLTLHGLIRALPDKLLVSGPEVKRQAMIYNDLKSGDIEIVGVAHYDKYFAGSKISPKDFFGSLGLDPSKLTLFYAPIGDFYVPNNDTDPYILDILKEVNVQVIVRFSPTIPVKSLENAQPSPNMVFDRPGLAFEDKGMGGRELTEEDDDRLLNIIYFSDVTICGPSSIALDATFVDRPVIVIDFHPTQRRYLESVTRRYDYEHFRFAIQCGAFKLAKSKQELLSFIKRYFKNPSENSRGRRRLRHAYCGPIDGKSGQRIAQAILAMLST